VKRVRALTESSKLGFSRHRQGASDANATLVQKEDADTSFGSKHALGGERWLLACPNAAPCSSLQRKITSLEFSAARSARSAAERVLQHGGCDEERLFGICTNHGACERYSPKQITLEFIGKMNRDLIRELCTGHRSLVIQAPSSAMCGGDHRALHEDFACQFKKSFSGSAQKFQADL